MPARRLSARKLDHSGKPVSGFQTTVTKNLKVSKDVTRNHRNDVYTVTRIGSQLKQDTVVYVFCCFTQTCSESRPFWHVRWFIVLTFTPAGRSPCMQRRLSDCSNLPSTVPMLFLPADLREELSRAHADRPSYRSKMKC